MSEDEETYRIPTVRTDLAGSLDDAVAEFADLLVQHGRTLYAVLTIEPGGGPGIILPKSGKGGSSPEDRTAKILDALAAAGVIVPTIKA